MTDVTLLPVPRDREGWTADDLDDLPDDGLRYELVEGRLLVSPPAPVHHNATATDLAVLLAPVVPQGWAVVAPAAVQLSLHDVREPDLVVCRRSARGVENLAPADVLLVVEVMSPGSVSQDRLVKPAQYAAAGIPHYWRLEPREPVLITHVLDGSVYRESARCTDEVDVADPVALRFRLADVLP